MKNVIKAFSLCTIILLSFAFTPYQSDVSELSSTNESNTECVAVDLNEVLFGTGKFGGCYISPAAASGVDYLLVPQNGGASIGGTLDCGADVVTLDPFIEYDIFLTNTGSVRVWAITYWEFQCTSGGTPGINIDPGDTVNAGSIFVPC